MTPEIEQALEILAQDQREFMEDLFEELLRSLDCYHKQAAAMLEATVHTLH
jgi:hypothetical protein